MEELTCRCCQIVSCRVFDWERTMYKFVDLTYAECFHIVTHLGMSDEELDLPQAICFQCAKELKISYEFQQKAQKTDLALREKLLDKTTFEWVGVPKQYELETHMEDNNKINQSTNSNNGSHDKFKQENNYENSIDNYNEDDMNAEYIECGTESASSVADTQIVQQPEDSFVDLGVYMEKIDTESFNTIQKCPHCYGEFPENELQDHINNEHKTKRVLCDECPRYFRDNHHLRRHQVVHERNRQPKFTCEICGRKFLTKCIFQGHMQVHDENRKRPYKCDECDKAFFHKPSLRLHKQRHAGVALECKICNKKCLRPIDLEIHTRKHTGDFKFGCEICGKGFATKSQLVRHIDTHKGMRFACEVCGKVYAHKASLRQHGKTHTGLPLQCALCNKKFERNSKVRRHIIGVHKMANTEEVDGLVIDMATGKPYIPYNKMQTVNKIDT